MYYRTSRDVYVSVNQQPSIGECSVKLYARSSPDAAETVVGTATCEDIDEDENATENLEPLTVWVGGGLNSELDNKGITKLEANWRAEYNNPLSVPDRPTTLFFVTNTPAQLGITGGRFTVELAG